MSQPIYLYPTDGPPLGPYSPEQLKSLIALGDVQPTARAGFLNTHDPIQLDALLAAGRKSCEQCQGELIWQTDNPQQGTGVIVIVLGILFAPFCVGIPILIWGLTLTSQSKSYWHCRKCGRTFPA